MRLQHYLSDPHYLSGSFPEPCFWPKPRYCPFASRRGKWCQHHCMDEVITRMKLLLSPRQTLPSTTSSAGAPCPGTAQLLFLPGQGDGGRPEHTLHVTHVFILLNHSLFRVHCSIVFSWAPLSVQRKPVLQKYCFAAAPPQCLLYSHWLPKQCWGCFCSLCRSYYASHSSQDF